ncbi:MAG: SDR family oxidoreductase [Flavobacteriales bacterium]|nr:SDR family oxidoreductase [Flavobacteriales bacterium]
MSFLDLENKTILITGATGGIGSANANLLVAEGAKLILTGRKTQDLEDLYSSNPNVKIIQSDLKNEEEIIALVQSLPQIDGLVHCAGIVKPMPVKFIKRSHIEELFSINYYSAVLLCSYMLKQKKLNSESSTVFISSISSKFPYLGGALYVSSKAALESFVKTLALEHSNLLRANIVSPGLVRTKILEETEAATGKEEITEYEKKYPLGFGDPQDVANTCAFLLSKRSKWITGENIIMDGGLTLGSK